MRFLITELSTTMQFKSGFLRDTFVNHPYPRPYKTAVLFVEGLQRGIYKILAPFCALVMLSTGSRSGIV
jgi:hypothetical protein